MTLKTSSAQVTETPVTENSPSQGSTRAEQHIGSRENVALGRTCMHAKLLEHARLRAIRNCSDRERPILRRIKTSKHVRLFSLPT